MENYRIRRADLTTPIVGYVDYVSRNSDSLPKFLGIFIHYGFYR